MVPESPKKLLRHTSFPPNSTIYPLSGSGSHPRLPLYEPTPGTPSPARTSSPQTMTGPESGLLLVYTEPQPTTSTATYEEWHDTIHVPPLLSLPGPLVLSCTRWVAADGRQPTQLALYGLASPSAVYDPAYLALGARDWCEDLPYDLGGRGMGMLGKVGLVERRIYEPTVDADVCRRSSSRGSSEYSGDVDEDGRGAGIETGRYMSVVEVELRKYAEEEFNRWFEEEHIPLLRRVPGWVRTRRFTLTDTLGVSGTSVDSDVEMDVEVGETSSRRERRREREVKRRREKREERPPKYLAMHEWTSVDVFRSKEFKRATSTPWRMEVLKGDRVVKYEIRVFRIAGRWEGYDD